MIEAGRSWRRGVRTHVSLETANPAGLRFQVMPFLLSLATLVLPRHAAYQVFAQIMLKHMLCGPSLQCAGIEVQLHPAHHTVLQAQVG